MAKSILLLLGLTGLLLVAPTAAQDVEDGCTQASPCVIIADVDENGFSQPGVEWNGTSGDWYVLQSFNFDDVTHTLTIEGHAVTLTIPSIDEATSQPFQLGAAGTYAIDDAPTGDFAFLLISDASQEEQDLGAQAGDRAIPGLAGPAAFLILAGAARWTSPRS